MSCSHPLVFAVARAERGASSAEASDDSSLSLVGPGNFAAHGGLPYALQRPIIDRPVDLRHPEPRPTRRPSPEPTV